MNRRELFRSSLITLAGAAATATGASDLKALEFPPGYDASKDLARPDWKPQFLNDHQNETLIVLSDLIIPETDTPGAKAALVNRFLDLLLSADTAEAQRGFLNSLSFMDGEARARYGNAFIFLPKESQVELLHYLAYPNTLQTWGEGKTGEQSGHSHFQNLKRWIAQIFFTSKEGLETLGWNGEPAHGELTGCEPGQKKAPARAN